MGQLDPSAPTGKLQSARPQLFFPITPSAFRPSAIAWLAKREGIQLMGIIDFDTLEGTEEFLWACEQLNVRGTVSLETRIYLPEFADRVITSMGQLGVALLHSFPGFHQETYRHRQTKPILIFGITLSLETGASSHP